MTPPDPHSTPIDTAKLWRNFDDDAEFLGEQVAKFEKTYPSQIQAIRDAVEAGDSSATRERAHRLAGSVTNFAAHTAWAAAIRLEERGVAEDVAGAKGALVELELEMERLFVALRALAGKS